MTETAFYILLSLTQPRHGYAITDNVKKNDEQPHCFRTRDDLR